MAGEQQIGPETAPNESSPKKRNERQYAGDCAKKHSSPDAENRVSDTGNQALDEGGRQKPKQNRSCHRTGRTDICFEATAECLPQNPLQLNTHRVPIAIQEKYRKHHQKQIPDTSANTARQGGDLAGPRVSPGSDLIPKACGIVGKAVQLLL